MDFFCTICGDVAQLACEECYNSFYCNEECQSKHVCNHISYEDDEDLCHMCNNVAQIMFGDVQYCGSECFELDQEEDICMVCDSAVPAGADYCSQKCKNFDETKYINGPQLDDKNRCDVCGKEASHVCGHCKVAIYCGKECQQADRILHWTEECYHPNEMTDDHVMEYMDDTFVGTAYDARMMLIGAPRARRRKMSGKQQARRNKRLLRRRARKADRQRRKTGRKGRRLISKGNRTEKREAYKNNAPVRKEKRKAAFGKFKAKVKKFRDKRKAAKAKKNSETGESKPPGKFKRFVRKAGYTAGGTALGFGAGGIPGAVVGGVGGKKLADATEKK